MRSPSYSLQIKISTSSSRSCFGRETEHSHHRVEYSASKQEFEGYDRVYDRAPRKIAVVAGYRATVAIATQISRRTAPPTLESASPRDFAAGFALKRFRRASGPDPFRHRLPVSSPLSCLKMHYESDRRVGLFPKRSLTQSSDRGQSRWK